MARYGHGVPPFMENHLTNPDPYGLAKEGGTAFRN